MQVYFINPLHFHITDFYDEKLFSNRKHHEHDKCYLIFSENKASSSVGTGTRYQFQGIVLLSLVELIIIISTCNNYMNDVNSSSFIIFGFR